MKRLLTLFGTLFTLCCSAQYNHKNIGLYANFDDTTVHAEPKMGLRYSSCYGYYDSITKREYGIIGATKGTYIVDVTNPSKPVQVCFFAGAKNNCIWREYKTYKHYLYAVSDDPDDSISNTFQIFDLSTLPNATKVYDSDSLFSRAHTIFVDGNKLYAASVKKLHTLHYRMAVYSLEDPVNPRFFHAIDGDDMRFPDDAHDMYVRNDTAYISFGNAGLHVYTLDTLKPLFTLIGEITHYLYAGFNHSSVVTPDHKTMFFTDELPYGMPVKMADVSVANNMHVTYEFNSNLGANNVHPTPHNPYLRDKNTLILSYYSDGIQVYDISDSIPVKSGFFDTYPDNGDNYYDGFQGCWAAYVGLPSGTLIASDIERGMFILNMDTIYNPAKYAFKGNNSVKVYPNPFTAVVTVEGLNRNVVNTYSLFDEAGRLAYKTVLTDGLYTETIDLSGISQAFIF